MKNASGDLITELTAGAYVARVLYMHGGGKGACYEFEILTRGRIRLHISANRYRHGLAAAGGAARFVEFMEQNYHESLTEQEIVRIAANVLANS